MGKLTPFDKAIDTFAQTVAQQIPQSASYFSNDHRYTVQHFIMDSGDRTVVIRIKPDADATGKR